MNVLITSTVSGLWHGANWTFVVWGLLNGLYYLPIMWLGRLKRHVDIVAAGRTLPSVSDVVGIVVTFWFTTIAWVFFRSDSLTLALDQLNRMLLTPFARGETLPGSWTAVLSAYIGILVVAEWLQRERRHGLDIAHLPVTIRWPVYLTTALAIALLGNFGELQFILRC